PLVTGGDSHDNSPLTAGPHLAITTEAGLRFERTRVQAEIVYLRRKEDGSGAGAGVRHYDGFHGRLTRRFTPRMQGSAYGALTDEDFAASVSGFEERVLGAELGFFLGLALGLDLRVEHRK